MESPVEFSTSDSHKQLTGDIAYEDNAKKLVETVEMDQKGLGQNVLENEEVVYILPDVPKDYDEDVIETTDPDLDAQIERRLTRLKFFSSVWCQSPVSACTASDSLSEASVE